MILARTAHNGSLTYLKLSDSHENVVRYDFSSGFKLWSPEFGSMSVRYLIYANFGSISFTVFLLHCPD